jgi:hypothetical protein
MTGEGAGATTAVAMAGEMISVEKADVMIFDVMILMDDVVEAGRGDFR